MEKRHDFKQQAAQLIIKKSTFFCGHTVYIQHISLSGNAPPARYNPDDLSFTVLVPYVLSRRDEICFIDYALGAVEHYIKCVLWRSECEEESS